MILEEIYIYIFILYWALASKVGLRRSKALASENWIWALASKSDFEDPRFLCTQLFFGHVVGHGYCARYI